MLGLLLFCFQSKAQQIEHNHDLWTTLNLKAALNKKFYFNNELHIRRTDHLKPQQLVIRPSINWQTFSSLKLGLGYTYIKNYPYGESVLLKNTENNIWFEVVPKQNLGKKFSLSHRYRWEGRWVQPIKQEGNQIYSTNTKFTQRFRYRTTLSFQAKEKLKLLLFNEFFLNLRDGLAIANFNQNWFFAGVAYQLHPQVGLTGGVMQQWVKNSNDFYQNNPTVQLTVSFTLPDKKTQQN